MTKEKMLTFINILASIAIVWFAINNQLYYYIIFAIINIINLICIKNDKSKVVKSFSLVQIICIGCIYMPIILNNFSDDLQCIYIQIKGWGMENYDIYDILVKLFNIYLIIVSLSGGLTNVIVLNDERKNIRFIKYICIIIICIIIIFCIKMFKNYCNTYNEIGEDTGVVLDIKYICGGGFSYSRAVGRKKFNVEKGNSITVGLKRRENRIDIENDINKKSKTGGIFDVPVIKNDFIDIIDINEKSVIVRICESNFGEGKYMNVELTFDKEYAVRSNDGYMDGFSYSCILKFYKK